MSEPVDDQAPRETAPMERVISSLTELVLGELGPGAQLPSEAALASRYEVSRLTIREAMKVLAGRGLIDAGRGRRAIVREPDGSAFGDFLSAVMRHDAKGLFDLVEVRQGLEVQSVMLAAKRINRAGIAAIEATLDGMRGAAAEMKAGNRAAEERFHQGDVGFHEALALSSGNRMLAHLIEALATPLRESFHLSMRGHRLLGLSIDDTIAAHEAILAKVKAGDGRGAAQAMRSHLRDAGREIRTGLSARLVEDDA